MGTYNVKTARLSLLIIFPSEPGLISRSCRKKRASFILHGADLCHGRVCHLSNAATAGAAVAFGQGLHEKGCGTKGPKHPLGPRAYLV